MRVAPQPQGRLSGLSHLCSQAASVTELPVIIL